MLSSAGCSSYAVFDRDIFLMDAGPDVSNDDAPTDTLFETEATTHTSKFLGCKLLNIECHNGFEFACPTPPGGDCRFDNVRGTWCCVL